MDQSLGLGGLDLVLGQRTKWTVMEDQVDLTWSSGQKGGIRVVIMHAQSMAYCVLDQICQLLDNKN